LAGVVGFLIAVHSAAFGVAGGEMRIPALIYLFALPIKEAGTISLLASLPTVLAGGAAYRRAGHVPNRALLVAALMAAGSLAGVMLGTMLLPSLDKHMLKAVLGVVLLVATAAMVLPDIVGRKPATQKADEARKDGA
jgi:uncharacterized membrane protein YfcA